MQQFTDQIQKWMEYQVEEAKPHEMIWYLKNEEWENLLFLSVDRAWNWAA